MKRFVRLLIPLSLVLLLGWYATSHSLVVGATLVATEWAYSGLGACLLVIHEIKVLSLLRRLPAGARDESQDGLSPFAIWWTTRATWIRSISIGMAMIAFAGWAYGRDTAVDVATVWLVLSALFVLIETLAVNYGSPSSTQAKTRSEA